MNARKIMKYGYLQIHIKAKSSFFCKSMLETEIFYVNLIERNVHVTLKHVTKRVKMLLSL